jgi:transposase
MSSVLTDRGAIHLGLDVHKNTISVGILEPDAEVPVVDKISSSEDSVRRLIGQFDQPSRLRACYEAGPTGYQLGRLLGSLHVRCEVIAPSLIPTAPGDRVKTDKRDCRRLARLHRAGAGTFMGFCGLVPGEYSSGDRTRRGHITHAGNLYLRTQLVESARATRAARRPPRASGP